VLYHWAAPQAPTPFLRHILISQMKLCPVNSIVCYNRHSRIEGKELIFASDSLHSNSFLTTCKCCSSLFLPSGLAVATPVHIIQNPTTSPSLHYHHLCPSCLLFFTWLFAGTPLLIQSVLSTASGVILLSDVRSHASFAHNSLGIF
jgi:hypothetical protein